jgi:RHS repeat-associated protein
VNATPTPKSAAQVLPRVVLTAALFFLAAFVPSTAWALRASTAELPLPVDVLEPAPEIGSISYDALGSPTALTDELGAVQTNYHLDAWGIYRKPEQIDDSKNRFGFTGYEYSPLLNLYYANARFYDPEVGRFTSQDSYLGSIDNPPSLHRFAYAHQQPTYYVDPTGHAVVTADPAMDVLTAITNPSHGPQALFGNPANAPKALSPEQRIQLYQHLEKRGTRALDLLSRGYDKLAHVTIEGSDFSASGKLDSSKVLAALEREVGSWGMDPLLVRPQLLHAIKGAAAGQTIDISEIYSVAHGMSTARSATAALRAAGLKSVDLDNPFAILGSMPFNTALMGLEGYAPRDVVSDAKHRIARDSVEFMSMAVGEVASVFGAVRAPAASRYLVSGSRVARFQAHVDRLRQAGLTGERLAELQGRVEMLKGGYLRAAPSKLVGNLRNPGRGHGVQGLDQVFRHFDDATDLAILESKYSAGFRMGDDPTSLLSARVMGQQMSHPWVQGNIQRMITGPHTLRTNTLGWELGTQGYSRYMNVMNQAGESGLVGLIF